MSSVKKKRNIYFKKKVDVWLEIYSIYEKSKRNTIDDDPTKESMKNRERNTHHTRRKPTIFCACDQDG